MAIVKTVTETAGGGLVVKQEDSGQTDGTEYFYCQIGASKLVSMALDDTPGAAGTNTYTVEQTNEAETALASCKWEDVTNDLYGAASFTADKMFPTKEIKARALRLKRVRSADGGNNDGGSKVWFRID